MKTNRFFKKKSTTLLSFKTSEFINKNRIAL